MIYEFIAVLLGNFCLAFFHFFVHKFDDLAAHHADQMVMMMSVIQFKYCSSVLKISTSQNTGGGKLGQDSINGG